MLTMRGHFLNPSRGPYAVRRLSLVLCGLALLGFAACGSDDEASRDVTSSIDEQPSDAVMKLAEGQAASPTRAMGHGDRPNVLLIIVDDLRSSLGCFGDELADTPHIDSLANESLVFDRAYCQQALCSPSRSSMLTGRRPNTTGVVGLSQDFRKKLPDVVTLPQMFREAGYQTRAFGKVHHGHGDLDDEASWSQAPWRLQDWSHYHTPESLAVLETQRQFMIDNGYTEKPRGPAIEVAPVKGELLVDGEIASEAIRCLEELQDQPFFLAVGFRKPHLPFVAPAECFDRYDPDQFELPERRQMPEGTEEFIGSQFGELRASPDIPLEGPLSDDLTRQLTHAYYACVSHVDDQVGRLIAALERLDLTEDTVVVFWSDHGFQLGELGQWCKHTNFEEAVRAPFFLRLPKEASLPESVEARRALGAHTRALVEFVDLYPTLAELAGLPADNGIEGLSLLPLFVDPERPWKQAVFSQYPRLVPSLGRRGMGFSMRTDRHRFTIWRSGGEFVTAELYDYQVDPAGARNLAQEESHAQLRQELEAQHERNWRGALPPVD